MKNYRNILVMFTVLLLVGSLIPLVNATGSSPTATALSCITPLRLGFSTSCNSVVTGANPTGIVTFSEHTDATGSFSTSTCTLSTTSTTTSTCNVTFTDTTLGNPTITAIYQGDSNNSGSSISTFITVDPTCTSIIGAPGIGYSPVTPSSAAIVATSGQVITGLIDASGCDVGVYVGPGVTGVTITATVTDALYAGIDVSGGNANVIGSTVSNIGDNPFTGDQYGIAIFYGDAATGEVINSQVSSYQKSGIEVLDAGSVVTVSNDTVTGLGPVPIIAQNGVEFDSGASGSITNSTIQGNSYSATCNTQNYNTSCAQSGGILLFDAAPNVIVSNNKVSLNDIGIWEYSDSSVPEFGNYVVNNNLIQNNYGYGIVFDGYDAVATNDTISNSPVGILTTTSSTSALVNVGNINFNSVTTDYQNVPENKYSSKTLFNTPQLVYSVNANVINDADSGNSGTYWALDTFNRAIQIWQTGVRNYTIKSTDVGLTHTCWCRVSTSWSNTTIDGITTINGQQSRIGVGTFDSSSTPATITGLSPVYSTANASIGTFDA